MGGGIPGMPDPGQIDQMMENPMVQGLMNNPDVMREMMMNNPQVCGANPLGCWLLSGCSSWSQAN